ncbi:DNA polymerase IV [Falsarthrobacter nasiphocae]|uniref:DNA polymerase IV n=1 Tax=Falsarthrobacter nasiphocae TaxID=189863 RepID=A0AAE3YDD4_9MICC|nr:DNA polymerase IV [Falsarthrobacter nasiphocae]MDR6891329.1 DNA polymerase-4 [Falsarthrobacter nasiphocae]
MRQVLHVDMDAFFLSVELLERPELRGTSCLVAFDGPRSVVLSASYEARARGIRSAMPLARARGADPRVVVLEPRHELYRQYSARIMEIFRSFTPLVEPLSVDEAFLDVTGAEKMFGPPLAIAREIRRRIKDELGLTASVGVASTKFVAKVASTQSKPDGLFYVPAERTEEFLRPLPVGALWGVGAKSREALLAHGLSTIAHVADAPAGLMRRVLGENGVRIQALARGIDPRPVEPTHAEKSLSADRTFLKDLTSEDEAATALLDIAHRVGSRLRRQGLSGRGVSVKIRWADFTDVQRSRMLEHPTNVTSLIYSAARDLAAPVLAAGLPAKSGVRLLSIRVDRLVSADAGAQFDVFAEEEAASGADGAMDAVRARFGDSAITVAGILPPAAGESRDVRGGSQPPPGSGR